MTTPRLLLASNSPRRKELLALTGLAFRVLPANVDETQRPGEDPVAYVQRLAETKARAVANAVEPGQVILAADTIVVDGPEVLGKPADEAEASAMLRQLRGRTHQVYTAIALLDPFSGQMHPQLTCSDVTMRDYSDAEIDAYVATGDPLDKAGAYAIQNAEFHPVERYCGCFASIMGLPLCAVTDGLRQFGIHPAPDVPATCQDHFHRDCLEAPAAVDRPDCASPGRGDPDL
jgi:MAF protein